MEYREKMLADAEKLEKELFESRIRGLEKEYGKAERREEVKRKFAELFRQWGEQTEKEAASLGICYLHSDILMRTGEMRLTLYGKDFYLDEEQLEMPWRLPCFFEMYEDDIKEIVDWLRQRYPRLYRYEKDAVRYQYAEYYYAALESLCEDMLDEIKESEEYREMKKTEDFFFFFGRWRGEGEKL